MERLEQDRLEMLSANEVRLSEYCMDIMDMLENRRNKRRTKMGI